jgi:AraC-like DNA-binding protein/quercetin dioxygenase-like cupin family protein
MSPKTIAKRPSPELVRKRSRRSRAAVSSHAQQYAPGALIPPHRHGRAQLLYASEGTMTVSTRQGSWVIPPDRALWIPAGVLHQIRVGSRLAMRTLYFPLPGTAGLPRQCQVLQMTPLMRELVLAAMRPSPTPAAEARLRRIHRLILDELRLLPETPLHLPTPTSDRLRRVANALADDPADPRGLALWARQLATSPRSLARAFRQETGLGFQRYRRQVRLLAALERLAAGASVTNVALDLGYDSPSAFIAMFRRALGSTPKRYFSTRRGGTARA